MAGYAGLAATFDRVAGTYQRMRPGYPAALFADLSELTSLPAAAARVLEVGPGTGQATRGLLGLGWSVVGLEPGPALAEAARRELAGLGEVEVVESTFERWDGEPGAFDLVLAATSWHWVDPAVGYRRAVEALRPGGHLAVVTTDHVLAADGDPFFRDVEQVYEAVGLSDGRGGPQPRETLPALDVDAMTASRLFEAPAVRRYVWSRSYTAPEYLALLSTYSNHIAATAGQRERLFAAIGALITDRPGASVRKHYLNTLQLARRLG